MPRARSKEDLIKYSKENYDKLNKLIDGLSEKELNTTFDFSADEKKKELHWKRDENLRDVLIHLYEWHKLLLDWVNSNMAGVKKPFIPKPYTFKTYGDMNLEFWKKNQGTTLEEAKNLLEESHSKTLDMVESLSDEQLFAKGLYKWTGTTTIGSYCASSMSSHYEWALKKIRAHKKNCKGK